MKAFIVYPTYRIENNKSIVELYGRLENGKTFLTRNEFEPYFFIKTTDVDKAKGIVKLKTQTTKYRNFQEEKLTKIILIIDDHILLLTRNEFLS